MRKLLITLLALPGLSFASSLDMSTLKCKNMKITTTTTLKQIQDNCLIKKEKPHDGMYEVEFANDGDPSKKNVKCDFGKNDPTAVVNGCR